MDKIQGASPELVDFILKLTFRVKGIEDNKERYPHKAIRKWARALHPKIKSRRVQSLTNALIMHQFSFDAAKRMLDVFSELTNGNVEISFTDSNGMHVSNQQEGI